MTLKHLPSKVAWPLEVVESEGVTLTRQSTHSFNCLPFSFVQRQSMPLQLFRSLTMAEQAVLHCFKVASAPGDRTNHGG